MSSKPFASLRRIVLALAIGVSPLALSGCVALAVGAGAAGAVAYIRGDLQATLSQDVAAVTRATEQAIAELRYFVVSNQQDATSAVFTMRNARDDRITISIKQAGPDVTRLSIRVGMFGDEELSRVIYDAIRGKL